MAALATLFTTASFGQITIAAPGGVAGTTPTATPTGAFNLRAEGTTELTGDLQFDIAGGTGAAGTITIFLNAPVTSPANALVPGTTVATLNYNGVNYSGVASGTQLIFSNNGTGIPILAAATTATLSAVRVNANAVTLGALTTVTEQPEVTVAGVSVAATAATVVGYISPTISSTTSVVGPNAAGAPGTPGTAPATYNTGTGSPSKTALPGFYVTVADTVAGAFKQFGPVAVIGTEDFDGNATFGTRVQLSFGNVPAGVTLYVPTTISFGPTPAAPPLVPSFVLTLVTSATAPDAGAVIPVVTPPFSLSTPATAGSIVAGVQGAGGTTIAFGGNAPITPSGNAATAVYEVTLAPASATVSVKIPVWVTFPANTLTAASGAVTVLATYAPMAAAAAATTVPNFAPVTTGEANGSAIILAQTDLLYPFVTSAGSYDTGIAIANTSSDPFGTTPSAGSCNLNFYGTSAPTTSTNVAAPNGSTAGGSVNAFLLSSVAPGFSGYVIAVCPFNFAHGFAYIVDNANGNAATAMGYVADVINDRSTAGTPLPASETLTQ
ncbi:MAG TPA: hypothetical protein VHY84_09815 [Bryobacteraceae bacterium]|nr:hypothetical protein [Bryobacteraceae bacterium]